MVKEVVKPLNIDRLLGHTKNRVMRIGVELEGGWTKVPDGTKVDVDRSVFKGKNFPPTLTQIGEIPIGPIQPAAIPRFLKKYYPSYIDETCGMHVHMSFEVLSHYQALMVPEFQETMIEYLRRWADKEEIDPKNQIWERLEGKSIFCQKKFWPDDQVGVKEKDWDKQRKGHRYTLVHYCGRKNTIEVRVLPMFEKVETGISAVKMVVAITNASLVALRAKWEKLNGKVELESGEYYEEFEEQML